MPVYTYEFIDDPPETHTAGQTQTVVHDPENTLIYHSENTDVHHSEDTSVCQAKRMNCEFLADEDA